ncbi:MAG: Rrf2 family transcriptional regulator [Chthoniobacterales bacterium]
MGLSKRCIYGLRALIDLGIAQRMKREIVRIQELADGEKIPEKFLEQILMQLKHGGYLESVRGKYGGYRVRIPMDSIRFGDVVRLIDGPLAPIPCVSQTAYEKCSCPDEVHCGLRMLMLNVRNAISDILDRYTLKDVVDLAIRKMQDDKVRVPFTEGNWFEFLQDGLSEKAKPVPSKKKAAKAPAASRK